MTDERAVNTVADVAFALLFVSAAIGVLAGYPIGGGDEHDARDADRTAAMVGASTINATYSVEPLVEAADSELESSGRDGAAVLESAGEEDLVRVTHGSIAEQVGTAAVANVTNQSDGTRLPAAGDLYAETLDDRVKSRLVGSRFETRITAVWVPYEGSPLRGTATVGTEPPPQKSLSTAEFTVPSGFEPVRADAIQAAETGGYDAVAATVAAAVVEGYLRERRFRHALEGGGVERALTLYRFERLARLIDGDSSDETVLWESSDEAVLQESLRRHHADPGAANEYLASKLAEEFATNAAEEFDTPSAAARAVSTSEVTVTITTWEP